MPEVLDRLRGVGHIAEPGSSASIATRPVAPQYKSFRFIFPPRRALVRVGPCRPALIYRCRAWRQRFSARAGIYFRARRSLSATSARSVGRSMPTTSRWPLRLRIVTCTGFIQCGNCRLVRRDHRDGVAEAEGVGRSPRVRRNRHAWFTRVEGGPNCADGADWCCRTAPSGSRTAMADSRYGDARRRCRTRARAPGRRGFQIDREGSCG